MQCEEKVKLVEAHHEASAAYSRLARMLSGTIGTAGSVAEYKKLRLAVDEARIKSQEAHAAVARHSAEHGC